MVVPTRTNAIVPVRIGVATAGSSDKRARVTVPTMAASAAGGALAALGTGSTRHLTGGYELACIAGGIACLVAALLVLRMARQPPVALAAGE